jgi:leucyl/phenylalanyl-tRNA--protein transferase
MPKQMLSWLEHPSEFPPTDHALQEPNGLLAASGAVDAEWLQQSYPKGIFPWYNPGEPVLWWSPNPRAVLFTDQFKLHRSLRKVMTRVDFDPEREIRMDSNFEAVMRACAAPRDGQPGTWITEDIIQAYLELHRRGLAHSIEHWHQNQLVGGLYCVSIGHMVFGESMFSTQTDASKVAFGYFVAWLKSQNVRIIDCQQATRHLMSFGACSISRLEFETIMHEELLKPGLDWRTQVLSWTYDKT